MSTPFVSILLTVRNAGATLRACLDSLVALDYSPDRYEIVVVDGGSRDGTLAILRDFEARLERAGRARAPAPRFLLLEAAGNIPHGRNAGLQHCRGEFVAVTDGDVIAPAPWLKELVAAAADGVAAVGGPNNTARSDLWSRAVACIPVHGPTLDEVPPFGPPRFAAGFVTDRWVYAAVTRNCLFRREVITGAGGFDPAFERTEDVELNARLLEAGHRLAYTPRAGVLHHHRSTLAGFIRQQWGYARWQAVANAKHAGLSHPKHRLPPLALGTLALSALAAAWRPALWPLPAALVTTGAIGAAAYGWRCALLKRDPGLVAAIPPAFAAWMLAWAIGYPWGMWRRRKVLAGGYR